MAKKRIYDYVFHPGISYTDNLAPNAYYLLQQNKTFLQKEVTEWLTDQIAHVGTTYTPTNAVYTPTTGVMEITIGTHSLNVGDYIRISGNSLVFTCGYDNNATEHSYPRSIGVPNQTGTDPYSNNPIRVDSTTSTTITVNVGISSDTSVHTFVRGKANSILVPYTPTDASYDPATGLMQLTIGAHDYELGDFIRIQEDSLTFTCALDNDATNHTYPRATGSSAGKKYTPTNAVYTPTTGVMTLTIGAHDFSQGDDIRIVENSLTFTCALDGNTTNHTYPRSTGSNAPGGKDYVFNTLVSITATTATTITVNVGISSDTSVHTFVGAIDGAIRKPDADYAYNKPVEIVATSTNTITVDVGISSNTSEHTFVSADGGSVYSIFAGYTFNASKCQRDVGYAIDAYLYDIRYGGNTNTIDAISLFWDGDVSQVDGNRLAEVEGHTFLKKLILDFVLTNTEFLYARQNVNTQVIDLTKTSEPAAVTKLEVLLDDTTNIIENGLSVVPVREDTGVSYIKVIGNYNNADFLLMTNTDRGEIIYNFAKAELGGFLEYHTEEDDDFPKFLDKTDAVTIVNLFADTTGQDAADDIQIFIDEKELRTRPFDFGTDAIERMRVAPPLSMLDADFEYGLQPTKWSAIGTLRGYPSTYEVVGTELNITSATTDASIGSQGVGSSVITVTTAGAHTLEEGDPVVVKALDLGVVGAARAEGTFIVTSTPATNEFTYLAKAKVGTTSGEEMATNFTVLRKAGFYTGATIGSPEFTIDSQGSSGVMTAALNVPIGSDFIPFEDDVPEIGSPLSGNGINQGTQVTGIVGAGGTVVSPNVTNDAPAGSTSVNVDSVTGILPGLAVDRGDGVGVTVLNVVGNTVNLSDELSSTIIGNVVDYIGVNASADLVIGSGAEFTISRAGGSYTIDAITQAGTNYDAGEEILVDGADLGGLSSTNDATITISTVDSSGGILTATIAGAAFDGNASYTSIEGNYQHGNGAGASFDVTWEDNVYSLDTSNPTYTNVTGTTQQGNGSGVLFDVTWSSTGFSDVQLSGAATSGYAVNDIIQITGSNLGGTTPANDLYIKVTGVDGTGAITTFTYDSSGAPSTSRLYGGLDFDTGTGTNAQFDITTDNQNYLVNITNAGSGYTNGDSKVVTGDLLGGATPANDVTITISSVDVGGEILTVNVSGTAVDEETRESLSTSNIVGSGATFDVEVSASSYVVTVNNAGTNYASDQTILITGDQIGGSSPTNDLTVDITAITAGSETTLLGTISTISGSGTALPTMSGYVENDKLLISGVTIPNGAVTTNDIVITVTGVDGSGYITSYTFTGTAPDVVESYSAVTQSTTNGIGTGASFNIDKNADVYSVTLFAAGVDYAPTNTITILGSELGGDDGTNNLTITVNTVDVNGEILTFSIAGTAANRDVVNGLGLTADNIVGSGATWDVDIVNGVYSVTEADVGINYGVGQTVIIPGTSVGGASPTNDIEVTVTAIGTNGSIASSTFTGTAAGDVGTYTAVSGSNITINGSGATFNVTRDSGSYTSVTLVSTGVSYETGNRLIISGNDLGGVDGVNDILITVTDVDSAGSIVTFTDSGTAVAGAALDFISSVTLSESTVGGITNGDTISFSALATILVTFETAHGLIPGSGFNVVINSDDGVNNHNLANGPYIATSVPDALTLTYQARAPGAIDDNDVIAGNIYPKPDSFFIHRPYDGGVQLGTGGPQHGAQAIRQSKKYIRYQSGKGIMYTTGALFAPSYDILSISADNVEIGSTITVTTDENDHGLQVGGQIRIIGVETPGYNHDYTVTDIVNERTFRVTAQYRLGSTDPVIGFGAQISTVAWNGATVRSGIFDDQNGIFWEYDGTYLSVVQRTSTKQLAGTIAIDSDSSLVTGTGTRFRDQVKAGDRIVIKGMTHVISGVTSQTEMTVTPDFRGVVNISGAKACLITDKKIRQQDFNLDRLDGTGASKYNIDPAKMQMIGIQYSWYGAGFIDFMVRGADGNFVYAHRIRNSNVNTEAYMRSGNLPVRYEVTNEGANDRLSADMTPSQDFIPLQDASFFPPSGGTVYIDNELISFTGVDIDNNRLTGCTRSANLTNFNAGAQRSYTAGSAASHSNRTGVVLVSNTITPLISHWGSSFITDGNFDEDRGYIFSYTEQSIPVSTIKQTAFLLRLAPSVSNAITGDLGERELLNRAQLLIQGIEISSDGVDPANSNAPITGGIVVEGVLNPQNYPDNPANIVWSGLSSEAQGGQPSFAQIAAGGSVQWSTGQSAVQANITAQSAITGTATTSFFMNANNADYIYMTRDSVNNIGLEAGDSLVSAAGGATFPAGTTVRRIENSWQNNYIVRLNQRFSGRIQDSETITFSRGGDLVGRNFMLATAASLTASGASVGTDVVATTAGNFPANTKIQSISEEEFAGTIYYRIIFNNSYNGTLVAGTGTITVEFVEPPYAQPGETVFSFIATPGERANLNLDTLKELTNTTLGGRGTFPNGPDVLAINVYKTSGADTTSNIILRWGEAQA